MPTLGDDPLRAGQQRAYVPVLPHLGRGSIVLNADRKIRSLMAERRSIYTQVTALANRIKQQARPG